MRNDTAFMDRIHAYLPGWDLPKVSRELLTNHFGLVSDLPVRVLEPIAAPKPAKPFSGARALEWRPERT